MIAKPEFDRHLAIPRELSLRVESDCLASSTSVSLASFFMAFLSAFSMKFRPSLVGVSVCQEKNTVVLMPDIVCCGDQQHALAAFVRSSMVISFRFLFATEATLCAGATCDFYP
jgi:hypothetical protein